MASGTSSTTIEESASHECLPFSPHVNLSEVSTLADIPRYLFRVHAPSTAGRTTSTEVASKAALLERPNAAADIMGMPVREAADMLNCHLRGWARDTDNLMSWSSSLLFVLQYALYRSIKKGVQDAPCDIQIHVLDTEGLPQGALIPDITLLDHFVGKDSFKPFNLSKIRYLRRETMFNFGEYLCQGTLSIDGHTTSASLLDLINQGLLKLCPELGEPNEKQELARRVCKYRASCFMSPASTTKHEVRIALALAEGCFGDAWALPMMAAFLSLRKRRRNDSVIAAAFEANFSEREIQQQGLGPPKLLINEWLPEVIQFGRVIQDIHSDHCTRALDSVIATTTKLSLCSESPVKGQSRSNTFDVEDDLFLGL